MKDQIRIHMDRNIFHRSTDVFLVKTTPEQSYVGKVEWLPVMTGANQEPTFSVPDDGLERSTFILSLIDALTELKVIEKPVTLEQVEKELEATKFHLNDMREYSDRLLDAVVPVQHKIEVRDNQ